MTHSPETFWRKIKKGQAGDCWEWTGYRNVGKRSSNCKYGRIDIFGKKGVYVHRVAYFLSHPGEITLERRGDELVLHRCDNPICCNPRHLYIGSSQQNSNDMVFRGRAPSYDSWASPRAKLSAEQVRDIRARKKSGETVRALAQAFRVSMATISGCLYGRHYQDVI